MNPEEKDPYQAPSQDKEADDSSGMFKRRTTALDSIIMLVPSGILFGNIGFDWHLPGPSFQCQEHEVSLIVPLSALTASLLIATLDWERHRRGISRFISLAVFILFLQGFIIAVFLSRGKLGW